MMVDREKIKKHKRLIIIGVFVSVILVNGGFFPIANFNPDNPVDLGITLRIIIIVMAFTFHKSIGSLEAVILSERSTKFIGIFNTVIVLFGLAFRYLLEFGEVSNTYNFTIFNVSFQAISLAVVSTVVFVLERKKN